MLSEKVFARDEVLASWWTNALDHFLSGASFQFQLTLSDPTTVQVPASAGEGAAAVAIGGLWRWVEAALTAAHPGGAAGSYPIFVTASNNNITNTPDPFTDDTDYSFALQVLAPGATPTIVAGTVDKYRQVGWAVWDGSEIVQIEQIVPAPSSPDLTAPWTAYAPAYTGDLANPNFTGCTITARYKLVGKLCIVRFSLTFGGAFNGGKGGLEFGLPVAAHASGQQDLSCKLFIPNGGSGSPLNLLGVAFIAPGEQICRPLFSVDGGSANMARLQNADGTGAAGTGVPTLGAGGLSTPEYPFQVGGDLEIWGAYETV